MALCYELNSTDSKLRKRGYGTVVESLAVIFKRHNFDKKTNVCKRCGEERKQKWEAKP